jgi:hypothetical protein
MAEGAFLRPWSGKLAHPVLKFPCRVRTGIWRAFLHRSLVADIRPQGPGFEWSGRSPKKDDRAWRAYWAGHRKHESFRDSGDCFLINDDGFANPSTMKMIVITIAQPVQNGIRTSRCGMGRFNPVVAFGGYTDVAHQTRRAVAEK